MGCIGIVGSKHSVCNDRRAIMAMKKKGKKKKGYGKKK